MRDIRCLRLETFRVRCRLGLGRRISEVSHDLHVTDLDLVLFIDDLEMASNLFRAYLHKLTGMGLHRQFVHFFSAVNASSAPLAEMNTLQTVNVKVDLAVSSYKVHMPRYMLVSLPDSSYSL